jgi:DNA-directed RNA polymerase II subunit RPB1
MYSDYNDDNLIFRIRITKSSILNKKKKQKNMIESLDQSDEIYLLQNLQEDLLNNLIIRGVKNINKVLLRKITDNIEEVDMKFIKKEEWVLDTVGTNLLELLSFDFIDSTRTTSNSIIEIYNVLGIEAARQSIFDEFSEVIEFDSTYINYHHITILCDRMTCNDKMVSIFRHGINNDNIGPIAKASFEETPEMFLKAARHGELDNMRGISANVMCGQQGFYGTNCFKLLTDIDEIIKMNVNNKELTENEDQNIIHDFEKELNAIDTDNYCNTNNLLIESMINTIKNVNIGKDDDYDIDF